MLIVNGCKDSLGATDDDVNSFMTKTFKTYASKCISLCMLRMTGAVSKTIL